MKNSWTESTTLARETESSSRATARSWEGITAGMNFKQESGTGALTPIHRYALTSTTRSNA
jgi:hypothetical protein